MQELAAALEIEPRLVVAWEDGEKFPTKRHVEAMQALAEKGPTAIARKGRRRGDAMTPMQALADPGLWSLFRKLLAHPELRRRALEIAETYDDPE